MGPPLPFLTLTYGRQLAVEEVDQWCYAAGECVRTDPIVPFVLLLVTGLLTLIIAVALVHIEEAWGLLETEREQTQAERAAFEEFARRVNSLPVSSPRATVGQVPALEVDQAASGVEPVAEAYRETVMAVSHYEDEYDEPFEANLVAELGPDVATAVAEGSILTPELQTALASSAREAATKRERLLRHLDREATALEDADERLSTAAEKLDRIDATPPRERSYAGLIDAREALGDVECWCRDVLTERQGFVQAREAASNDVPSLRAYLYGPLDVDYPVLACGAAMMERIQSSRAGIESALARR